MNQLIDSSYTTRFRIITVKVWAIWVLVNSKVFIAGYHDCRSKCNKQGAEEV